MDPIWWVALLLMGLGLVGTIVPGLPGILLVFVGALVYAVGTGFQVIGVGHLAVFGALTLVGLALDIVANVVGARAFGASKWGLVGAALGAIVGLFVAPPIGLLVGPLVGAVALEALSGRTLRQAFHSGVGAMLGFFLGVAVEIALAATIIVIFLRSTWL
jgi:uncharacterized protein YqgC (DUF456 family)